MIRVITLIANLLQNGELRPLVGAVIPLSRAPEAFAGPVPGQHRGKVVVSVDSRQLGLGVSANESA
jgi:NADPH:quinone reductase-like Zn-dependent oxidoreductase